MLSGSLWSCCPFNFRRRNAFAFRFYKQPHRKNKALVYFENHTVKQELDKGLLKPDLNMNYTRLFYYWASFGQI